MVCVLESAHRLASISRLTHVFLLCCPAAQALSFAAIDGVLAWCVLALASFFAASLTV